MDAHELVEAAYSVSRLLVCTLLPRCSPAARHPLVVLPAPAAAAKDLFLDPCSLALIAGASDFVRGAVSNVASFTSLTPSETVDLAWSHAILAVDDPPLPTSPAPEELSVDQILAYCWSLPRTKGKLSPVSLEGALQHRLADMSVSQFVTLMTVTAELRIRPSDTWQRACSQAIMERLHQMSVHQLLTIMISCAKVS